MFIKNMFIELINFPHSITHTHTYTHTYTFIYTHIHTHIYTHTHTHTGIYRLSSLFESKFPECLYHIYCCVWGWRWALYGVEEGCLFLLICPHNSMCKVIWKQGCFRFSNTKSCVCVTGNYTMLDTFPQHPCQAGIRSKHHLKTCRICSLEWLSPQPKWLT
jgi:hypothetical protein